VVDIEKWKAENKELVEKSNEDIFSNDIVLQKSALAADAKLNKLRK